MINEKKIDIIKSSKPFRVLDIIVFIAAAAIVAMLIIFSYSKTGTQVEVTYNEKSSYYSLNKNAEINIEEKLTVVIRDGAVWVTDADCPDKVCEHSGKITRVNRVIVCAPQGIIIKIIDKETTWAN